MHFVFIGVHLYMLLQMDVKLMFMIIIFRFVENAGM